MSIVWTDTVTPLNAANMNQLEQIARKGAANGYASLDSGGKVPLAQTPLSPVTNGQWLKGVGGAAVWSAITPADVGLSKVTAGAISAGPPGSPATGDIWIATDVGGAGSGLAWQFRYNGASALADKWEFVGGPSIVSYTATVDPVTGNVVGTWTYTNPVGPDIVVPRSGFYTLRFACGISGPAAAVAAYAAVADATVGPAPIVGNMAETVAASANASLSSENPAMALTAGHTLRFAVYQGAAGVSFFGRSISITPLRVS